MNSESPHIIRSARFRQEREAHWQNLEAIVNRAERHGVASLDFNGALELAHLYREAIASLSVARDISLDRALLDYLESLCCRAYLAVYAPQQTLRGLVWRFFAEGAPQALRRSSLLLCLASVTFVLGSLVGYRLFLEDPAWYNTFVPSGMAQGRGIASTREQLLGLISGDGGASVGRLGAFAASLFSHNSTLTIFAFALGIAAGVPTLLLLFYNGLILGALFALYADRGLGLDLFAWLSVHGTTELLAIVVGAAGGFRLGSAILFPGAVSRSAALRRNGPDAVKLALLAATMLVVAALLEGFARQLVTGVEARLAVGWGAALVWCAYLMLAGRGNRAS